jgi:hypothetical protein
VIEVNKQLQTQNLGHLAGWRDIHFEVTVADTQRRREQSPVGLFPVEDILDWVQDAYLAVLGEQFVWMVAVDIEDYQTVMGAYVQVSNMTEGEWDLEARSSVLGRLEIDIVRRLLSLLDSWASEEAVGILHRGVGVTGQLPVEELPWNWGYITLHGWKATTADEGLGLLCRLKPFAHQKGSSVRETSDLTKDVPMGGPNCSECMEEVDDSDTMRSGSLRTGLQQRCGAAVDPSQRSW